MTAKIKNWLETRIGLEELIRTQLTGYMIPRNINLAYTLGFVALAAFVSQVITGFFLLIYYVPDSEQAFRSVQDMMSSVPFGWLFRSMHAVGSNLMVAVVILHMLSVFLMGSYKKPREMTWVAGLLMLLMTLTFCLSGYLLPWSQLSYWATTIVTTIPTAFPYVGDFVTRLMRGGEAVSGITLNRFFAMHVTLLPLLLISLIGIHLFLVRRIGISAPPFGRPAGIKKTWTSFRHESYPDGHPLYPYFILREMSMVAVYFGVMFFIIGFLPTLFLPENANLPADPFRTPGRIKPEWYFLAPYQMLKLIPNKLLGISIQMALVAVVILWPFLDTKDEDNILKRPLLLAIFVLSLTAWAVLTVWGHYS
ncbi:MAG: cytochrome bc complex cytochrome b subunit [Nitrospirae bacterium]|nr:cytochrome bc complex cytochrome b subunit [Nitrospirota bacterium]